MIRLNVFIQVEKSCRDKVLDIARKLTECSLKEPGCVAYDIFESSYTSRCTDDLRDMERCPMHCRFMNRQLISFRM